MVDAENGRFVKSLFIFRHGARGPSKGAYKAFSSLDSGEVTLLPFPSFLDSRELELQCGSLGNCLQERSSLMNSQKPERSNV